MHQVQFQQGLRFKPQWGSW